MGLRDRHGGGHRLCFAVLSSHIIIPFSSLLQTLDVFQCHNSSLCLSSFSPLPPSRKNSNLAHREKMCRKMVKCKYKLRFYCSPFGLPPFNLFISNNNRQQKQPRRRSFKKTAFLLPLNFTPPYCKTNDFQSCPAGL